MATVLMPDVAGRLGVSPFVHDDDLIWQFIRDHPNYPTAESADTYYLEDGAASAQKLADLIARNLVVPVDRAPALLEFASGYGCVSRHLPAALPGWSITSSDIHPQAVAFLQDQLGIQAALSRDVPEELELPEFDVVFALSFFSHMPRRTWGRWLRRLFDFVRPGGILAITTHGSVSWELCGRPELDEDGFSFIPTSEQYDIDTASYGSTVTTPDFVVGEIWRQLGLPIKELRTGYWWAHQDLWVIPKPA